MEKSDRPPLPSAHLPADYARRALEDGNRQRAWQLYHQRCMELLTDAGSPDGNAQFIHACLELSQLGFVLGKNFYELTLFLSKALEKAEAIGDRRSITLINLHLGRLYYFGQRRVAASAAFEKGAAGVVELGDEDIRVRASEFLGLNHFMRGELRKAYDHFELGLESYELQQNHTLINILTPVWAGYCTAYMGQFNRAIGTLDYYRRICLEHGDRSSGATLRAVLGIVLLMARKTQDALHHLTAAHHEATECGNTMALYFAGGGMAYHLFARGEIDESYATTARILEKAQESGIHRQYASPIFLEQYYGYHRHGIDPLFGTRFEDEVNRVLQEPNILIRGVALRLRALDRIANREGRDLARGDLERSKGYLTRAGASIELSKTLIEMARMALHDGEADQARGYATLAIRELGGYTREFYPDDLQHLLRPRPSAGAPPPTGEALLAQFMEITRELELTTDLDATLYRVVKAVNRLLGAERGGVFWFGQRHKKAPKLRASHHLTHADVQHDGFTSNLALIFDAYRTGQTQMAHAGAGHRKAWPYQGCSLLCIPIPAGTETLCVLYYDSAYMAPCFEHLSVSHLQEIVPWISRYIERLHAFSLKAEAHEKDPAPRHPPAECPKIVTRSPAMEAMLEQAERIAPTDSSVLILGETGVGKELLARHIHARSERAQKPFVVIDPSTMPENLVESVLFGHEKGAFTGADRQQKGRLEMAHTGTLFIDEIGDMPLSVQVKLLRTLQEKTILRVGGSTTLYSDFRLIAATHRDLTRMIAAGTFREDLFYRINVVPMHVPPLKERKEDILPLARFFLHRYAAKYHRPAYHLLPHHEAALCSHSWPGNIRELKNLMERSALLSRDDRLELILPSHAAPGASPPFDDLPTMRELQRRYIRYVLDKTHGKQSGPDGAAAILGMKRSTLYNRMKALEML